MQTKKLTLQQLFNKQNNIKHLTTKQLIQQKQNSIKFHKILLKQNQNNKYTQTLKNTINSQKNLLHHLSNLSIN